MPTDHRGNYVDGPHNNCVNCGDSGALSAPSGKKVCHQCMADYMSYLPYMPEGGKASWDE
jgi:hypothetical protein